MTEPIIWELDLPQVTVDDLFQVQGAGNGACPPRPATWAVYEKVLAEAVLLVKPTIIWREVDVLGVDGKELLLAEGQKLTSRVLTTVAGTADKLILYALTIGSAIDEREKEYSQAGQVLEAFALAAAGTAFVVHGGIEAVHKINHRYHDLGLRTTFSMGPGHSYWPGLEDMSIIFHILQAQQIGLRLTDANLIWPSKSMAMVMGAGPNLPDFQGKTHCDFCSLSKRCQLSHYGQKC